MDFSPIRFFTGLFYILGIEFLTKSYFFLDLFLKGFLYVLYSRCFLKQKPDKTKDKGEKKAKKRKDDRIRKTKLDEGKKRKKEKGRKEKEK